MYVRRWTARFSHVDMFRYVFYPELSRVIHDTSDMYLDDIGYSYQLLQDEYGIGLPLVEIGATFERPVRIGDTVEITLTPSLGETSLRFEYVAEHIAGETAFTAHEHRACVPLGEQSSVPIPDDLRAAIRASMH